MREFCLFWLIAHYTKFHHEQWMSPRQVPDTAIHVQMTESFSEVQIWLAAPESGSPCTNTKSTRRNTQSTHSVFHFEVRISASRLDLGSKSQQILTLVRAKSIWHFQPLGAKARAMPVDFSDTLDVKLFP
jgi:hypothetical protein